MQLFKNVGSNAKKVGVGVAGGALGRVVTKQLAPKIPGLNKMPKLSPAPALAIGLLGMDMKGTAGDAAYGMAVVAGVDILSNYVPTIAYTESIGDVDAMAEALADELEESLNDDVDSANSALNDDVDSANSALNDYSDDMADDVTDMADDLED